MAPSPAGCYATPVRAWIALLAALCGGCLEFGDKDAKVPGDELGMYQVTGRLTVDTCKADVLGVKDPWRFQVRLSRFDRDLYWLNGREAIVGDIAADGVSFEFQTRVDVDLEPAQGPMPGCIIERRDVASGKLSADGPDVEGFEGDLSFTYSPKAKTDCSFYVGYEGTFATLPCTIGYAVEAERTGVVDKP